MVLRNIIFALFFIFSFPAQSLALSICEFQVYKMSPSYQEELKLRNIKTQLQLAEKEAIKAIFDLVLNKDEELLHLQKWMTGLEKNRENLNIAEHSALSYLYRNSEYLGLAISDTDREQFIGRIEVLLKKSWMHLTQQEVEGIALGDRLPRSLLDGQSNKVLMFYQTSFNEYDENGKSTLKSVFHQLISTNADYKKFITTMILTSMAVTATGGVEIGLGMTGLLLLSLGENWFHRFLAHAKEKFLNSLAKVKIAVKSGLYQAVLLTSYNHKGVHHGPLTYRNEYGEQFPNREQMDKVDALILKRVAGYFVNGGKKIAKDFLNRMKKNAYGNVISTAQYIGLISPFIILTIIGIVSGVDPLHLGLVLGPGYFYPIGLVSSIDHSKRYEEGGTLRPEDYGLLSFHEYSHLKTEELDRVTAGKPLVKKILSTKISEILRGHHWVHHDRPDLNFNLTNFIADIFMGTLRFADMKNLAEMDQTGYTGYYWGESILNEENN